MSGGAGSSRGLSQGWSGARVHASDLDRHRFHYSTGKGRSNPHRAIEHMPAVLGVEGFRVQCHKSTMRLPSHISHRPRLSWYRLDGPPVSLVSWAGACAAA
jgi:hypothetical protein